MYRILFLLISTLLLANSTKLEHVKLQLKWKHQFQFAGYYVAKEKGFYKKVGLDVDILEFTNNIDITKKVENNANFYGVGYPSIILKKANGANIILLNAINQLSPHILLTRKDDIKFIKEFKNKRIMLSKEASTTASFMAMINSHHLKLQDMTLLAPTFNINALINKKVDITTAYLSNEPFELKKRGIAFDIWDPADYGFDFYDDILFTSLKELKEHPSRVKAFQTASLKGWEYAYSHIDETIKLIQKKYNTQNRTKEALLYEASVLKKLAYFDDVKLGTLEANKIKRLLDVYNLLGLVKKKKQNDPKSFIYSSTKDTLFTPEQKKYLKEKKVIKLCVDPSRLPYEKLEDSKHIGMTADYFQLLQNTFHLNIEVNPTKSYAESLLFMKEKKCDLLSLTTNTKEKEKYLSFTSPYFQVPLVVVTKINEFFINNLKTLKHKKIAIAKNCQLYNYLTKTYPHLEFIKVQNIQDGLQKVKNWDAYAYIGTLMDVSYEIQKEFMGELKISGKLNKTLDLSIGIRNDEIELFNIMQKAVINIEDHQIQKIFNNWVSVEYVKEIDYNLFFKVLILAVVIISIMYFLYRKEKKLKEELVFKNIVFDTIINSIENPMFYKDKNGVYQNANDAFAKKMIGIDRKDFIGKRLDELHGIISDAEIDFYNEQDKKLYKSQKNQVYETTIRLKTGELKEFRIQKNIFYSKKGNILGYVGFMYDITEIKKREKELEYEASTDPMTKLYNRRYFMQMGETILKIAKREQKDVSILMFDIDDFKKVNDTYGHKIGDDVIIAIANTLQNASRESDVACRFGGEEFILLLSDTHILGAQVIAQKIRKEIELLEIALDNDESLSVTVSIGVNIINTQEKDTLQQSIKKADDALYKAKENGKNRVEIF